MWNVFETSSFWQRWEPSIEKEELLIFVGSEQNGGTPGGGGGGVEKKTFHTHIERERAATDENAKRTNEITTPDGRQQNTGPRE